jgi:hypothetical protein
MRTLATGLLVLLSALVAESSSAQQSINAAPDAIFYNGKIITVDSALRSSRRLPSEASYMLPSGLTLQSKRSLARIRAW